MECFEVLDLIKYDFAYSHPSFQKVNAFKEVISGHWQVKMSHT